MTDRELMQQALDYIIETNRISSFQLVPASRSNQVITALRDRLAQPEQEPVAWGVPNTRPTERQPFMTLLHSTDGCQYPEMLVPLYTAPPPRQWQKLTQREIDELWDLHHDDYGNALSATGYEHAIEAKLRERNA